MQNPGSRLHHSRSVLREELLFGGVMLPIYNLLVEILLVSVMSTPMSITVLRAGLVVHVLTVSAFYFFAGRWSARRLGRAKAGLKTGFLVSLFCFGVSLLLYPFLNVLQHNLAYCGVLLPDASAHCIDPDDWVEVERVGVSVFSGILFVIGAVTLLETLFVGWSMGWLGGLLLNFPQEKRANGGWKVVGIASVALLGAGSSLIWMLWMS